MRTKEANIHLILIHVKRFVDCKVGTPAVREGKKLNRKEMYFGDMKKYFSQYY